jgi:hypothetical protein
MKFLIADEGVSVFAIGRGRGHRRGRLDCHCF